MTRILPVLLAGIMVISLVHCPNGQVDALASAGERHGLALSGMKVRITSKGHAAIFRLYDTKAAREFHDQLPLALDLENFRDAQWMFYPPEKLNVTASETYHDGKKGELSYYAPWGDVFMLYKDFYAGDEMHRLGVGLGGVDEIALMSGRALIQRMEPNASEKEAAMRMNVTANGRTIVFQLNGSQAARDLLAQSPLEIEVENYGDNEKIFYPPEKLRTGDTPLLESARAGSLAYYAPWGDVVMFHGDFGSAPGLYELGSAVQGAEHIKSLSGTIHIDR